MLHHPQEQANLVLRRAFAGALPIAALAGATIATAGHIAPAAACSTIDTATYRCRNATQALAAAIDAYERALPPLHLTLDLTHRRPRDFTAAIERRLFDGATPKRGIGFCGNPGHRYVATAETIESDLQTCSPGKRERMRLLYRMRRRARARAAKIQALVVSFDLENLGADATSADHQLNEPMKELFKELAPSLEAALVQAKALSAYADTIEEQYATYQAGRFGKVLADGLQRVSRVA